VPYALPQFNLLCDIWESPNVPLTGPVAFENVAVQFYVPSRGMLDIEPGQQTIWVPPIYLRFSLDDVAKWQTGWIFYIQTLNPGFYIARWKERVHHGFTNEYLTVLVEQCDNEGFSEQHNVDSLPTPP